METTSHRPVRAARVAVAALFVAGLLAACGAPAEPGTATSATPSAASDTAAGSSSHEAETFGYAGRTGATALELLLEADPSAEVSGAGENAFVTAIGGRAADDSAREFWSLSVDGTPAQVGAGALDTEDGQEIKWTIETY